MIASAKNKMITGQNVKNKFFYPDEQLTIEAETKEEADKELKKTLAKNTKSE